MKYKIVTLSEVSVDDSKPLFFDTETCGLYGKVRLAQFYQADDEFVQMVEWPDQFMLMIFLNKYHLVMQNAHYDITVLQQETKTRWIPENFDDTFLLARLALPMQEKFDLESLAKVILGYDPYKDFDKKKLQKTNWAVANLTPEQLGYAATDVWIMPAIYNAVNKENDTMSYTLDMLTLKYCLDFQWNGVPMDINRMNTRYEANAIAIKKIGLPINSNSYQQVRPYIGSNSSDAITLAQLAMSGTGTKDITAEEQRQRATNVREVRRLRKQNSTLTTYLDKTTDSVLYGKFKPSARSGRLTSNDESLHTIPRDLKDCCGIDDGYLIYADYAQLELRTICAITACSLMAAKFVAGEDLHNFTAEMIFGKDFTKEQRQLTKTANFNFLYGGGIPMFITILIKQANMWIDEHEGYSLRKRWRNLWKEIFRWQEKGIDAWKKGKIWQTPLGRQYKGKMMTDQLNIQNQGAGAEVAKLALHYMMKQKITDYAVLRNFVHDSFILTADNMEDAQKAAHILADAMQEGWTEMSKLFAIKDLPMPVNVRIGKNWGDIENGKFDWELNQ